jgi:hypothetical protein
METVGLNVESAIDRVGGVEVDEAGWIWPGRHVFVVFASEAERAEEEALATGCRWLTERQAAAYVVRLPGLAGRSTGLRSYLERAGSGAFVELLSEADDYAASRPLWDLNDRVCYVRDRGVVVELETYRVMTPREFTHEAYAHATYAETVSAGKGSPRLVKRYAAVQWLKWAYRSEARTMVYVPGAGRFLAGGALNMWREGISSGDRLVDALSAAPEIVSGSWSSLLARPPGASHLGVWVRRLIAEPGLILTEAGLPAEIQLVTAAQLVRLYDPKGRTGTTVTAMGIELKAAGLARIETIANVTPYGEPKTSARFYPLRNAKRWRQASHYELVREWERWFGPRGLDYRARLATATRVRHG